MNAGEASESLRFPGLEWNRPPPVHIGLPWMAGRRSCHNSLSVCRSVLSHSLWREHYRAVSGEVELLRFSNVERPSFRYQVVGDQRVSDCVLVALSHYNEVDFAVKGGRCDACSRRSTRANQLAVLDNPELCKDERSCGFGLHQCQSTEITLPQCGTLPNSRLIITASERYRPDRVLRTVHQKHAQPAGWLL
jgi:hypothetical protein